MSERLRIIEQRNHWAVEQITYHADGGATAVVIAETFTREDAERIVHDRDALAAETARADRAEAQVAALEAENARLRDAVKGSWRFWAQTVIDAPTLLDRGYTVLRVRTDQFKAFDDIFRASAALAAPDPEPA